jgi:hypothetical protein
LRSCRHRHLQRAAQGALHLHANHDRGGGVDERSTRHVVDDRRQLRLRQATLDAAVVELEPNALPARVAPYNRLRALLRAARRRAQQPTDHGAVGLAQPRGFHVALVTHKPGL